MADFQNLRKGFHHNLKNQFGGTQSYLFFDGAWSLLKFLMEHGLFSNFVEHGHFSNFVGRWVFFEQSSWQRTSGPKNQVIAGQVKIQEKEQFHLSPIFRIAGRRKFQTVYVNFHYPFHLWTTLRLGENLNLLTFVFQRFSH